MCAQTTRLSDRQLKAIKPRDKEDVLTDGDGLQLRVRVNRSMHVTKNRINMALGYTPRFLLRKPGRKPLRPESCLRRVSAPKLNAMSYRKLNERTRNIRSRTWPPRN